MTEQTHETGLASEGTHAEDTPHRRATDDPSRADYWRERILAKLVYQVGKDPEHAEPHDWYVATALAVRDRIVDHWIPATRATYAKPVKRVYYLSLEFLIGRQLRDTAYNLGYVDAVAAALEGLGTDFETVRNLEPDAALGNGGLGRLAACFIETMASLGIAGYGYGIRYDHGLFRQALPDGMQRELPEDWLAYGSPWEFRRPEARYDIGFGGSVAASHDAHHLGAREWKPAETVLAIAYDNPVVGWRGRYVSTLRLWSARSKDPISLEDFNRGDHVGALADRAKAEAISKVLYPSDSTDAGQELRLRQEYFFTSASLQDMIRRHTVNEGYSVYDLPDHVSVQLNDTHPAIAVPELMRLLVDVYEVPWADAWDITRNTLSYTNHTLLPEALETWPVPLMERLLPRHMQIIYLINAFELDRVRDEFGDDGALLSEISLIGEDHGRSVRMGNLAFIGSHRINGVSALHTDLVRETVFSGLNKVHPGRIVNKTNGITFRRWLFQANPGLTSLIREAIGDAFLDDHEALSALTPFADDPAFREKIAAVRRQNKVALAGLVKQRVGLTLDPDALFDVHIKRIHEYKRQLLNILDAVALYDAIRSNPMHDWRPRVKIFAGKAAASYATAKLIIKLSCDVAKMINSDPTVRGFLKIVFLENYNVSLAETLIPATDLSEQISTAGMEASGTGNMKFGLNGALTIGTLDGANVEMRDHVGEDNIYIFGMTAEQVAERRSQGLDMQETIHASRHLSEALDQIATGVFSPDQPDRYSELVNTLTHHDYFMVTADFEAYRAMQVHVGNEWKDKDTWWRKSVLNTARMGWFSADRAIREYADGIWHAKPVDRD
ncbi:glycogen/starch/alpha-glucan phosphorylase [Amorphus orientalis]|uniref:Alpha-1,4 glucan phosphorylase n=1 Tax=Amorphus orientalis TaxID=649198 RepID=A0AAE3VLJ8_9HYPH|nr:glycogen/starch/alpha-glucan phosphorylase [Amorphus orientalis]MDQ0314255.1 starch phosphorylase [Amorphus orientalis]